jgi:hypothetical protein
LLSKYRTEDEIDMGAISIFSLNFSGTKFAVSRDLVSGYRLEAGDFVVSMTPNAAAALAEGGARIRTKANVASHFRREMKPGRTFARDMLAVDGRVARIEIGVTDGGDGVYLEVGTARMTLTDAQAQLLLAVIDALGRDVAAIYRAAAGPPELSVAQGLRGFPIRIPGGDGDEWI